MNTYSPSFDVLFGGLITFFVAIFGVWIERRHAQKERKKERLELLSAKGFSLQVKISSSHAWLVVLNRAIEECFRDVPEGADSNLDPGVIVTPIVGVNAPKIDFTADELALVLETGDKGLVEKLLSFQWNLNTTEHLVLDFNQERRDYSVFVADNAIEGDFIDPTAASVTFPATKKHAQEARVTQLNILVGEICESLPANIETSKELMLRLNSALKSIPDLTVRRVELRD